MTKFVIASKHNFLKNCLFFLQSTLQIIPICHQSEKILKKIKIMIINIFKYRVPVIQARPEFLLVHLIRAQRWCGAR